MRISSFVPFLPSIPDLSDFLSSRGNNVRLEDNYVGTISSSLLLELVFSGCQLLGVTDKDLDEDGDGYDDKNFGGKDCDDGNAAIHPGTEEIRGDGVDQNCNGYGDEDADLDGLSLDEGDCDDEEPAVRPGYFEYQDGIDNNCNDGVDESNLLGGRDESTDSFAVRLQGSVEGGQAGSSLAGGDLDGDGLADLVVGAPEVDGGSESEGAIYVLKGRSEWQSPLLLEDADQIMAGSEKNDRFGNAAVVGDLDGDGQNELVVAAYDYDTQGGNGNGAVGVFSPYETATTGFDQADPLWWGDSDFMYAGGALALSDMDGDGTEEVVVGAHGTDQAYLLSWNQGADGSSPLSQAAFSVLAGNDENFGWGVSAGNDLDGDGLEDIAVGAYGNSESALEAGAVYVYLEAIDTPEPSAVISGIEEFSQLGFSVATVVDMNGDGYAELLSGAPAQGAESESNQGRAYVLLGQTNWEDHNLSDDAGVIQGSDSEFLGLCVSGVGDINSDGFGDIAVGGLSDEMGEEGGAVYLFLGGIGLWNAIRYDAGTANAIFYGEAGMNLCPVAGTGDANGEPYNDTADDFLLGAPGSQDGTGDAFLIFGQPGRGTQG